MRRFLLFILAVLYLGVSSGFALNYHYCMGKLAEVSLQYLDTCPSCGEAGTSHKCCSTETEYVKLSVDQDVANTLVQLSAPVAVVLLFDLLDSYKIAGRDETLTYRLILHRESDLCTCLLRHKQQDTTEHNKP